MIATTKTHINIADRQRNYRTCSDTQLYNYLQVYYLRDMKQFGFRRKRSTSTALLQFADDNLGNMENENFEMVNHCILIFKLCAMGVDDSSYVWFKSYLNNRQQKTVTGNAMSSRFVNIKFPQGSVLGPLFFLVYINDLVEVLENSKAALFADDTAIYCSAIFAAHLQPHLNEVLMFVSKWMETNKLTLNVSN